MIIRLTDSYVAKNLQCPLGVKRGEVCDSALPGLYIEVRSVSQGQGTYYLRYKDSKGKTCHQRIGKTTEISLTDARKQAKKLKAEIELGLNSRGAELARQKDITFTQFFDEFYLPYVKPRKRSWKKDEQLFRLHLREVFGHQKLKEISRQELLFAHNQIRNSGLSPASADHVLKLARHAFNIAIEFEMLDKNPVARVPLFNEDNKVEHPMNNDELKRLMHVLQTHPNQVVCAISRFLLSTGARLQSGLQARWSDIDREHRVWRIPASNSKSKRIHNVPLNNSALDVINQLETEGKYEYLFINRKTGKPYTTIHKSWQKIRSEAGFPALRTHDLRHCFSNLVMASGSSIYFLKEILGHADHKTTERYIALSQKNLLDASNLASIRIDEAMRSATTEAP